MKKIHFVLLLSVFVTSLQAQVAENQRARYYKLALCNYHSAKPFTSFSSLFYKDFHPGVDIGYEVILKNKPRHQWFLDTRLGYMHHRWVQHNIALYTAPGYRYSVIRSWSVEVKLGAGYQLSIPHGKVFRITDSDGLKQKRNLGRSQIIANLTLGVNKTLKRAAGLRLFLEYKQQIQTPFIKEYVPLLPYNSLSTGIAIPLKSSHLNSKK